MSKALALSLLLCLPALAAAPKSYQVTGEVTELSDDLIVVMKGKERFEIARPADVKTEGELKVGSKVTVEYKMTASKITVKETAAKKK